MLTVAIPKRNKLQNIIVLTPKDGNGNVDKDASRRVEVKFRLKDEEMIDELNQLLSGTDSQSDTVDQTDAENTENN